MGTTYENLDAFYDADPRRRTSREADYGVWWVDQPSGPRWRVSYVQATGEVYAVQLVRGGRVEVLGVVPPDDEDPPADELSPAMGARRRRTFYTTLDQVLAGWPEHCGPLGGLEWVRQRLAAYAAREATA